MQMQYPQRIVAIWFQSGTAHSRWKSGEIESPEIPAEAMKIPMVANTGFLERDHQRFKNAWFGTLEMFRDYRSRGAPIAFAPDPKSGHETRDSRYLAIPFFDACLAQRLPAEPGTAGPLNDMDQRAAWLASVPLDPAAFDVVVPRPAGEYAGDPRRAVWLPNERVALAWREFIRTGSVSDLTKPSPPSNVMAEQKRDGIRLTWQAEADFESGIGGFEIRRNGQPVGRVPEDVATGRARPLFQKMSYHDTPESPLPTMQFFDAAGTSTLQYTVTTINGAGQLSQPASIAIHRELRFAEVGDQVLKLDLHMPATTANPPLVVWIHGGGWRGGSKARPPIRAIVERGFAVASISYRFTDKSVFPAQIHDCKAAIRWLRANADDYGYAAERIAVAGASAGAHLALLLGVSSGVEQLEGTVGKHLDQSSSVQAVIDYFGPSDFVLRGQTQPERAYTELSGSYALLGGQDGVVRPEMEQLASPATYVSADDPPLLAFHGADDDVVLLDQSRRIAQLYQDAGLDCQLIVLDKAGHGGKQFYQANQLEIAVEFLNRHR